MKRHQDRVVIELEHVTDPQGPADVARAYALVFRQAARRDALRRPAVARPSSAKEVGHAGSDMRPANRR
jgi:hypothetical protein